MCFSTAPLQLQQFGLWYQGICVARQVEAFKIASVKGLRKPHTPSKMAAL